MISIYRNIALKMGIVCILVLGFSTVARSFQIDSCHVACGDQWTFCSQTCSDCWESPFSWPCGAAEGCGEVCYNDYLQCVSLCT